MSTKGSGYPRDWLEKADQDLKRVHVLLENQDPEGAAFHLHQALEKYLKGFLISKGWELKRIHDLGALLDEALRYQSQWENRRVVCQRVSEFYLTRYPLFTKSKLDTERVEQILQSAQAWIVELKNKISTDF